MFVKRDDDFQVDILQNGFVMRITGRDEDDEWRTIKVYYANIEELTEGIKAHVALPSD